MSGAEEREVPICGLCGKEATGYAAGTGADGETVRYCHGDNDPEPTCYMRHQWGPGMDQDDSMRLLVQIAKDLGHGRSLGPLAKMRADFQREADQ